MFHAGRHRQLGPIRAKWLLRNTWHSIRWRSSIQMKIAMLAYAFYEGNARIQQYCNALVQHGHKVEVIALRRAGEPQYLKVKGVDVYGIQERVVNEVSQFTYLFRILLFLFRSAIVLTKRHHAEHYDLVHVHSVPDFLVLAALLPKLTGA